MRKRARYCVIVGALLGLGTIPLDLQGQWGGEVRAQIGQGGDALVAGGSHGGVWDFKLASYVSVTAGPSVDLWTSGRSRLQLQGLVGWATWSAGPEGSADRVRMSRIPADLLVLYTRRFPGRGMSIRVGGGVTYHRVNEIVGTGGLSVVHVDVEDATGPVVEASTVWGPVTLGLRYTDLAHSQGLGVTPMKGESVAVFFGIRGPL